MHFSVGNSIKLMSRNSHFGCLLIPRARRSGSDCSRNHGATAAAASKGKKGRSRNYYNYLVVTIGKNPDFQSLLALA